MSASSVRGSWLPDTFIEAPTSIPAVVVGGAGDGSQDTAVLPGPSAVAGRNREPTDPTASAPAAVKNARRLLRDWRA